MAHVSTDSILINVLVATLAHFLTDKLGRKVIGNGLGKGACFAEGENNLTAIFRFEGENDPLCTLEYCPGDGWNNASCNLSLVLNPYLKGVNRTVYNELELIKNTDIGIRRPVNRGE